MPLIYLPDIRLNARLDGPAHAPALVVAHALGTDLTIWDGVLAALGPRYGTLVYDQRGHGASDVPKPPYAMGALVTDLERLMDHFGLKEAVVGGSRWAGWWHRGWRSSGWTWCAGLSCRTPPPRSAGRTCGSAGLPRCARAG